MTWPRRLFVYTICLVGSNYAGSVAGATLACLQSTGLNRSFFQQVTRFLNPTEVIWVPCMLAAMVPAVLLASGVYFFARLDGVSPEQQEARAIATCVVLPLLLSAIPTYFFSLMAGA